MHVINTVFTKAIKLKHPRDLAHRPRNPNPLTFGMLKCKGIVHQTSAVSISSCSPCWMGTTWYAAYGSCSCATGLLGHSPSACTSLNSSSLLATTFTYTSLSTRISP